MYASTSMTRLLAVMLAIGMTVPAGAQNPPPGKTLAGSAGIFAYPAKGQKPDQQAKDEAECYNWSRDQSGYDPMSPPPAAAPAQTSQAQQPAADGARAKGALRGAAAGAVIGEVANNDAGGGAAIGATVGMMAGAKRSRMAQSQQQQQAQAQAQASADQAKATQQAAADSFKRGMTVCLESRGYAVK
jgi:hypothetical protein